MSRKVSNETIAIHGASCTTIHAFLHLEEPFALPSGLHCRHWGRRDMTKATPAILSFGLHLHAVLMQALGTARSPQLPHNHPPSRWSLSHPHAPPPPLASTRSYTGFDIPLSMGPALNSSFRANAFSLQSLFCALANESPVVRACCDWFSLCLVVLLHPADDHDQHQHLASSPPGDRDLLSPASSSGTAPITPASSYASTTTSTTTATPAPPSPRAPDAPSRAESGGISLRFDEGGAAITPATASAAPSSRRGDQHEEAGSNPGSHRQQRQHHHNASGSTGVRDRFSRATIHALGSVVLARRLARARGACLPAPVQAMMGLAGNPQEAFELLLEGVRSARQAFGTELEARQHYCNQPGGTSGRGEVGGGNGGSVTASDRGILAGEIFFERRVVGQAVGAGGTTSTISRTLLEWVTDDRQHDGPRVDDSASAAGDTESDGKPAAAATAREQRKRRLPPDFIQGVRLSSVTASIPAAPSPVGGGDSSERKHGSGACPRTPGSGISGGGAGGGASFGGSDTDTDPCRRGLRSVDDGAGSGWVGSTSGDGSLSYSVSDLSSSPEEEEKGSVSRCLERCDDSGGTAMQQGERYVLSNGGRCVFDDGAPSSAFSWTASSCTSDDSSSDSGSTPSLRSPSGGDDDQTSPPLPLSPLSASAAHVKQPAYGREEETPSTSTNPNISGDITASHDVRQRPRGKRRKINPRASQDATTTTAATKPHTNTETEGSSARARGLPARKAPNPEQQKNARWEALLERVLTALDDRCGCSFCGLRNGRVGERGDDDDDDDADGSSYGWVGDVDRGRIVGNDCLPPPSKRADTDGKRKSTVAAVKSPASPSSLARSSNFPPPIPVEEAPAGKSSPADKPPFPTTPSLATFSPFTPPGPPPPISTNPRSGDREPNGETLSPRDGTTTEGGGSGGVCGNGRGTGVACGTLVVSTIALASLAAVRMGGEAAAATAACGEESEGGRDWWW